MLCTRAASKAELTFDDHGMPEQLAEKTRGVGVFEARRPSRAVSL